MFVISIRDPDAFLSKPSEVSHDSLRNWRSLAMRAMPFICEGLVAAVVIEQRYPCGKHSDTFRFLGWLYLFPLVFALSAMVMVSDLFHPISSCRSVGNGLRKSLLLGLGGIAISGIASLSFIFCKNRK